MDFTSLLLLILVILVGTGIYILWPKQPPSETAVSPIYTYSLSPFYPANYGSYYYGGYQRPYWGNRNCRCGKRGCTCH